MDGDRRDVILLFLDKDLEWTPKEIEINYLIPSNFLYNLNMLQIVLHTHKVKREKLSLQQ